MKNPLVSLAVALALTGLACSVALAQVEPTSWYNEDVPNTTGTSQTSLKVCLKGDQMSHIAGISINPFANGTFSTSYDQGADVTTIDFSGDPIPSGQMAHIGYGLVGGGDVEHGSASPKTLSKVWSDGVVQTPAPFVTTTLRGVSGTLSGDGTDMWILLHADVTFEAGGTATGEWAEFQVPADPAQQGTFWFENNSTQAITLSNVGYQISSFEIPLDFLNSIMEPASLFTPVASIPDGTVLQPGQSAPEPGTIVLLAAAAIGLTLRAWRRRTG
jgi:hypothetical protein